MKKLLFLVSAVMCAFNANAELSTTRFSSNNYLNEWGHLTLVGNQLSSSTGEAVKLKGWSTYVINYDDATNCLSKDAFAQMKAWGANIVRLAVSPSNTDGGYASDSAATVESVMTYIKYCHELGMYCLINWNVSDENGVGDPTLYQTNAKTFFETISKEVVDKKWNDGVLYEAFSEPNSTVTWEQIKTYATTYVLPALKENDPGSICLVGTPYWCQRPDSAAADPINYDGVNIMYTFHYYACNHQYLLNNFKDASAKIPLFVSEWSSGSVVSGNTNCCSASSDKFMAYCDKSSAGEYQDISWCYLAWGQKDTYDNSLKAESCGIYTRDNLTTSGKYIYEVLNGINIIDLKGCGCAPENHTAKIPSRASATGGELNVGYYEMYRNEDEITLPDSINTKTTNTIMHELWGQGEGITYHDLNTSAYAKVKDPSTGEEYTDYTVAAAWGAGEEAYGSCNAGAYQNWALDTASEINQYFRAFECVDVTNSCAGPNGDWTGSGKYEIDIHNLCETEAGEWIKYKINVLRAGYYKLQCLTTTTTKKDAPISFSIDGENIIRDAESLDNPKAVSSFTLIPMDSSTCSFKENYKCWEWNNVVNPVTGSTESIRVLFKNVGEQTMMISVNPGGTASPGDFSDFYFTYDTLLIEDGINEDIKPIEFAIYPNPTEHEFNIVLADETEDATATVYNAQGQAVTSASFAGKTQMNVNLAKGVYMVQVVTKEGSKSEKLVIK